MKEFRFVSTNHQQQTIFIILSIFGTLAGIFLCIVLFGSLGENAQLISSLVWIVFCMIYIYWYVKKRLLQESIYQLGPDFIKQTLVSSGREMTFKFTDIRNFTNEAYEVRGGERREYLVIRFKYPKHVITLQTDFTEPEQAAQYIEFRDLFLKQVNEHNVKGSVRNSVMDDVQPAIKHKDVLGKWFLLMGILMLITLIAFPILVYITGKGHKLGWNTVIFYIGGLIFVWYSLFQRSGKNKRNSQ